MYKISYDIFKNLIGNSFDPDASDVIARFPSLSSFEKNVINILVISAKDAGNYFLLDELWLYGLTDGNIGFKAYTSTINGGTTHDTDGYTYDGIDGYLNSNYNPNSDGINYQPDNAIDGAYFFNVSESSIVFDKPYGADVLGVSRSGSQYRISPNQYRMFFNSNTRIDYTYTLTDNTLISHVRTNDGSDKVGVYTDGVLLNSLSLDAAISSPNSNYYTGTASQSDLPQSQYFEGTLSAFWVGANDGFDHVAHNEYMRIAIASLIDGTLVPDLASANIILS